MVRRLAFAVSRLVLAGSLPLVAAACAASAAPKTNPSDTPPMTVPPAPPRVIEPAPAPEPSPEPVSDLPAAPAAPRAPRREPPRQPATSEPKPEPKPETPPAEPAPPPATQAPVPQLSTPQTADSGEAARTIRATIDRARGTLATVNFRMLSDERKKAYNDAKMFLDQAETAIKQGNYTYAQGVATKAETLARELASR